MFFELLIATMEGMLSRETYRYTTNEDSSPAVQALTNLYLCSSVMPLPAWQASLPVLLPMLEHVGIWSKSKSRVTPCGPNGESVLLT